MSRLSTISRSVAVLSLGLLASLALPRQDKKPAPGAPPAMHEMPHGVRAWHVLVDVGPKFDPKTPIQAQPGFEEHAKRVHAMADDGTLLLGGPLFEKADSDTISGAVLVLKAKDEKELRERIGSDPLYSGGIMKIASVRPMMVAVGAWVPKEHAAETAK